MNQPRFELATIDIIVYFIGIIARGVYVSRKGKLRRGEGQAVRLYPGELPQGHRQREQVWYRDFRLQSVGLAVIMVTVIVAFW